MLFVKRVEPRKARAYGTHVCGEFLQFDFLVHEGERVLGCFHADDEAGDAIAKVFAKVPHYDVIRGVSAPVATIRAPVARPIAAAAEADPAGAGKRIVSLLVVLGILDVEEPHALSTDEIRRMDLLEELVALTAAKMREEAGPPPQRGSGFFGERSLPSSGDASPACVQALANGWTMADITGTGELFGDPGPAGGYSPLTGLTLAQMALSTPPDGWSDLAAKVYPWEVEGWRMPGIDWVPPKVPSKRAAPTLPPEASDPDQKTLDPDAAGDIGPGEITDPEVYELAKAEGRITEIDPANPLHDVDGTPIDPAIAAGYPPEHVDGVRKLVHTLKAASDGKPLHHNKVNWAIRKVNEEKAEGAVDVPTVTQDQLEGLLAVHPTT